MQVRFAITLAIAGAIASIAAPDATGQQRVPAHNCSIRILKEIPLSTQIPGHLTFVNPVEEGRMVRIGDIVIRLDDELIQAQLAHLEKKAASTTEIDFAKIAQASAEADLEVQESANQQSPGTFTETEIRRAKLEVDKAAAQLAKASEEKTILGLEAETKRVELKQYTVEAPINGVVTKVHCFPGQAVRQGDPVLTVADLSVVRAVLDIDQSYFGSISVGDEVELTATGHAANPTAPSPVPNPQTNGGILSQFPGGGSASPVQSSATPENFAEAAAVPGRASSLRGERFVGQVTHILPRLTQEGAPKIEVYVNVPNRTDNEGRYLLLEGIGMTAVVIHK
ncbi:MAG: efflux RND transporter periplasmic adaptor subunit [Planctomycetaceae bacterium]|nr:efflux RND transporter periplasmic adaptor subunit [Planctomycetaceae bacterium]